MSHDLDMTEEEILRIVLEESRVFAEQERENTRRQLIAEQDEEYRRSLEIDRMKAEVGVLHIKEEGYDFNYVEKQENQESTSVDEPREGDLKSLREARLRFFQK